MSTPLELLFAALPWPLKRLVARWVLKWDIHPTARIGRSILAVKKVRMGPGASIGHHNVVRGLEELVMGEGAVIDSRNHISGFPLGMDVFPKSPNRWPALEMGAHAAIMQRHEIDCSDRVTLGEHAVIAGFRCTILTHSFNLVSDVPVAEPVSFGHHTMVMSGTTILSGTRVPPRCIVSAGSVVTTKLTKELTFYRANPAEEVRSLPERLRFFRRGAVEPEPLATDA